MDIIFRYIKKIREYRKKKKMAKMSDLIADITCSSCFRLFPPSFYIMNDRETIERETKKELDRIRKRIAELEEQE